MDKLVEEVNDFFCGDEGTNFSFTTQDLQNPTPMLFVDFFRAALNEFSINIDHVMKPQLGQTAQEDQIPVLNLLGALRKVFPTIGIGYFDIVNPVPRRFQQIVRKTMDFMWFCDDAAKKWDEKMSPLYERKRLMREKERERERLIQELNDLALMREQARERKSDIELYLAERKKVLEGMEEKLSELKEHQEQVKKEKLAAEAELANSEQELEQVKQEVEKLEKIKSTAGSANLAIEELAKKKEELENENSKIWEEIKAKKTQKADYDKYMALFSEALEFFKEYSTLLDKNRTLSSGKAAFNKQMNQLKAKKEEILNEVFKLDGLISKVKNESPKDQEEELEQMLSKIKEKENVLESVERKEENLKKLGEGLKEEMEDLQTGIETTSQRIETLIEGATKLRQSLIDRCKADAEAARDKFTKHLQ